jgi:DNA-binding LacI/PurR family transcriptional regulator
MAEAGKGDGDDTRASPRPTIVDVAQRAGVSKSLVSLVLRGSSKVSPERREAVLAAAAELGYLPNRVARSLVLQRTHLIGLVISDLHNPFFAEVCDAIQSLAESQGYRAVVGSSGLDSSREADLAHTFLELRADGVILIGSVLQRGDLMRVARAAPTVVVSRHDPYEAGIDMVTGDDALGLALAVEHLVSLGHRRIAHVTGGGGAGAPERRAGYEQAMRERGLESAVQVVEGEFTEKGGYEAARELLAAAARPTAIIAANDLEAVGVLQAIEEAGRRVPDDISLVGYDNTYLAGLHRFSLTSVDQPRAELGHLALQTLIARIGNPDAAASRNVITPRLVIRGSTGAAHG